MRIILSLISLCLLGVARAADVPPVLEPSTRHSFASIVQRGTKKLTLAGVGVRVKHIGPIKAKVYSAAVYLDKGLVQPVCRGLKCNSDKDLLNSEEFQSTVVEGSSDKNIVLRMARSVGAEAMVSAVESSIKPRMKGKDSAALEKFSSVLLAGLKDGGAKQDTVFSFENCGNLKMTVIINGVKKGEIQSPTLCRAFTSIYLGADSVSPPLKSQVAKTLLGWRDSSKK